MCLTWLLGVGSLCVAPSLGDALQVLEGDPPPTHTHPHPPTPKPTHTPHQPWASAGQCPAAPATGSRIINIHTNHSKHIYKHDTNTNSNINATTTTTTTTPTMILLLLLLLLLKQTNSNTRMWTNPLRSSPRRRLWSAQAAKGICMNNIYIYTYIYIYIYVHIYIYI